MLRPNVSLFIAYFTCASLAIAQQLPREVRPTVEPSKAVQSGKTFALVIGISRYDKVKSLEFADKDAELLAEFLKSPLGGIDPANILLLKNEGATRAAIDDAVKKFVETNASPENSLVFFLAGHGVYLKTEQDPVTRKWVDREPYILTYDSNPQDPNTTGYPMNEFRNMTALQAQRYGRVMVYVDVCHAGNIAGISGGSELQGAVKKVMEGGAGDYGLLVASSGKNYAFESPLFGGGHGAFSYFLISGLNGSAAFAGADSLHWSELAHFVNDSVFRATNGKQSPRDVPNREEMIVLPDIRRPGIEIPPFRPMGKDEIREGRNRQAFAPVALPAETAPEGARGLSDGFSMALSQGKLLPEDDPGAYQAMLQFPAGSQRRADAERKLRVALEDDGQRILSKYLEGDQIPQIKADFVRCARVFEEAYKLDPTAQFDLSRGVFCRGRALIFDKRFAEAEQSLSESIRLDPNHSYAWNALGISKLEQINRNMDPAEAKRVFAESADAFRTAIRFAPYWAYPVHNLALALSEIGDFEGAIQEYRWGIELAPQYSYLPYNLGLLYQRLGDPAAARKWFEVARRTAEAWPRKRNGVWPDKAEVLNALGTLAEAERASTRALNFFNEALANDPQNRNARNNLALLLANRNDYTQADQLWRSVIKDFPEFMAARVSFAGSLAKRGNHLAAIAEYEEIVRADPDWAAAHEALAGLYQSTGRYDKALQECDKAMTGRGASASLLELCGDALAKLGRKSEAMEKWKLALSYSRDRSDTRRLQRKLS